MPGRATIHQVAKHLGVAASTVSRAFNQPNTLSEATVTRVHEAAEQMGYIPNIHARALSTGRTGTIGLIVPDLVNPFFPPLIRAAQREAELRDTTIIVAETNSDPNRERTQIASLAPHSEGLLIASSRLPDPELQDLAERINLVLINRDVPGVDRVLLSSAQALHQGIDNLVNAGARRFHYMSGPHRSWSDTERRTAATATLASHQLALTESRVESGTYQQARTLAAAAPDCDAIIAFDDIIGCGALDGLHDAGRTVPDDVRIIGCDDMLPVQTRPRLTTIKLPVADGAKAAMQLLKNDGEGEAVLFHGVLQQRET